MCIAESPIFDPEFLVTWAVLIALLAVGGYGIQRTVRWYRDESQAPSSEKQDLVTLVRSLEEAGELSEAELERLRRTAELADSPHMEESDKRSP